MESVKAYLLLLASDSSGFIPRSTISCVLQKVLPLSESVISQLLDEAQSAIPDSIATPHLTDQNLINIDAFIACFPTSPPPGEHPTWGSMKGCWGPALPDKWVNIFVPEAERESHYVFHVAEQGIFHKHHYPDSVLCLNPVESLLFECTLSQHEDVSFLVRLKDELEKCGVELDEGRELEQQQVVVKDKNGRGIGLSELRSIPDKCFPIQALQVKCWRGPSEFGGKSMCTVTLRPDDIMEFALTNCGTGGFNPTFYLKRISNWIGDSNIERAAQVAAEFGDASLFRFIMARSTDPQALLTAKDRAGSTILHMAVYRQHVEVVKAILELAPDIDALLNTVNCRKATPLHYAAYLNSTEMCGLILASTADFDGLLLKTNCDKVTAAQWATDPTMAHMLFSYRPAAKLEWSDGSFLQADPAHLQLGITSLAFTEALDALKIWTEYVRDPAQLGWLTAPGLTGYDGCAAAKQKCRETPGYQPFSILEIMASCGHPGVGKAHAFLSHAQAELITETLDAMRVYELQRGQAIKYFVDILALRQCAKDFVLDAISEAIAAIGCTVMVCSPWNDPFTLKRTFCAFEIYATVEARCVLDFSIPRSETKKLCDTLRSGSHPFDRLNIDIQAAQARHPEDKKQIDDFIQAGPGFEHTNRLLTHATKEAILLQAYTLDTGKAMSCDVLGQCLIDLGPESAVKVASALSTNGGLNMVHRFATSRDGGAWIKRMQTIFGGRTQSLITQPDHNGFTPLVCTLLRHNAERAQDLLDAAEDVEACLQQATPNGCVVPGKTPFLLIVSLGDLNICRLLLANAKDPQTLLNHKIAQGARYAGFSTLQTAAYGGFPAICDLILSASKRPQEMLLESAMTQLGGPERLHTALHGAAHFSGMNSGCKDCITVLMKHAQHPQALLEVRTSGADGETASEIAKRKGGFDLSLLLSTSPSEQ